jgi:hypothetical protein
MIQRNKFTYYFKEESVTLEIPHSQPLGNSYISFNCYSMQSRKRFKDFKKELLESDPAEYDNVNDIYGLASKHGVRATGGHKPMDFGGNIAF